MSWEYNPYYHPEKHGLRKLAEHELSPSCYSFDLLVAWADERGGIYLGTDSGCSCPTPFEDYNGVEDMTGPLTVEQALEEAASIKRTHYEPLYDPDDFNEFVANVRGAK